MDQLQVFGTDSRTLLSIDQLTVQGGSCVGIAGPSGAGKSTLLFALAGLAEHATGQIRWNDYNLLEAGSSQRGEFRRQHVGQVFQDILLFEELSALQNVQLSKGFTPRSNRLAIDQRAQTLLMDLGIRDYHRPVRSYSGGERQRVAVARALASDPDIILADEPTASLDRATADELVNDLLTVVRDTGKSLFVVSHDEQLLAHMDRIVRLVDGREIGADQFPEADEYGRDIIHCDDTSSAALDD